MNFSVSKIENCFADSRSFEYQLPVKGDDFLPYISHWDIRINRKLRRPAAIGEYQGIIIKFTLGGDRFRLSFPENNWENCKNTFETFLESL